MTASADLLTRFNNGSNYTLLIVRDRLQLCLIIFTANYEDEFAVDTLYLVPGFSK